MPYTMHSTHVGKLMATTSSTDDNIGQYLEALDEKRVNGRVQLLSRFGPEVHDDLLEYRLHLRTLKHYQRH